MSKILALFSLVLFFAEGVLAEEFVVPLNRSRLISTGPEIAEAMIANPKIADIHVHGPNRLSVVGIGRGKTTLRVVGKDGAIIKSVPIAVTYDLPAIRRTLRDFMPNANIGVELINNSIALVGEVNDAASVDRALEIVSQYIEVESSSDSDEDSGSAVSPRDSIVNLLSVTTGQQVMLRVRVGEINRNALKRIGINLQGGTVNGDTQIFGGTATGLPGLIEGNDTSFGQFLVDQNNSFGALTGSFGIGSARIGASLEALETDGLLKVLAEPNLVALSGEQAEFLAGGEIPIPVAQGGGDNAFATIEYRPFGVSVAFIPYVLSENRIRLNVLPEVSELSDTDGVVVNGFSVPSITTRRAKTTVELAPGESFMIAGLISDQMSTTLRQLPGVNEIPILGALFRSSTFQRNETELVIAVTPYLVDPLKSDDVRLPTDNFRPPSTMETFFYGALSSISSDERRISQTPSLEGPIGFMVE